MRLGDIDRARGALLVRGGKDAKDHVTLLPAELRAAQRRLTLEVATSDVSVAGSYANTVEGLADLVGALAGVAVHRVVLEASGGYERLALTALHAAGLPVVLVEPVRARHFARGLGKRAKTDAIDAAVLARMAEVAVSDNPLWEPLEDEVADLGSVLDADSCWSSATPR